MTLLRQIQDELASANFDITVVLRKCKILARRIHSVEFERWVDAELNGYPDGAEVPSYRTVTPNHYANFSNGFWRFDKRAIHPLLIPEEYRKFFEPTSFRKGIETVKALAASGGHVVKNELLFLLNDVVVNLPPESLWAEIPAAQFNQIISSVGTRVLDFVMDLEAENPNAGEAQLNEVPIPPEKVQQLLLTNNFYGPVGNVAQQSRDVVQTATIDITRMQEAVEAVRVGLRDLGLSEAERSNADAHLATLDAQLRASEPNPRVLSEAGRSLRSIIEGAVAGAVVQVPHWWPAAEAVLKALWS